MAITEEFAELLTPFLDEPVSLDCIVDLGRHEGESESAVTQFVCCNDSIAEVFAVRDFSSEESEQAAKAFVSQFHQEGAHPSLLPVNDYSERGPLIYHDGLHIVSALTSLCVIPDVQSTALRLRRIASGLAGFSRVYFFFSEHTQKTYIVKFDRPDRLANEWNVIERVRGGLRLPAEFQLPLEDNTREHGIMVYEAFQNCTASGIVDQLDTFLVRRLEQRPDQALLTLRRIFRPLEELYSDGCQYYEGTDWREYNQELADAHGDLQAIAQSVVGNQFAAERISINEHVAIDNPLLPLNEHLGEDTGRLLKSRVHGDLQATNILIGYDDKSQPRDVGFIDLEKVSETAPVVDDLVRIEADFWRSVFPKVIAKSDALEMFHDAARQQMALRILHYSLCHLNMVTADLPTLTDQEQALADVCVEFVAGFRERAFAVLASQDAGTDIALAYYMSMYMYYCKAMLRPLVKNNVDKLTVVLTAAGHAGTVVHAIRDGVWNQNTVDTATIPSVIHNKEVVEYEIEGVQALRYNVVVLEGGTLRVKGGGTLLCETGSSIHSLGTLRCEGDAARPLCISYGPKSSSIVLDGDGGNDSSFINVHFVGGSGASMDRESPTVFVQDSDNEGFAPPKSLLSDRFLGRSGGAVAVLWAARVSFEKCTFKENSAVRGGAVYLERADGARFMECDFLGNEAIGSERNWAPGGAILLQNCRNVIVERCLFESNRAGDQYSCGGAIYLGFDCIDVKLLSCRFRGNSARNAGGSVYGISSSVTMGEVSEHRVSSIAIVGCEFLDSTTDVDGSGSTVRFDWCSCHFAECTIGPSRNEPVLRIDAKDEFPCRVDIAPPGTLVLQGPDSFKVEESVSLTLNGEPSFRD